MKNTIIAQQFQDKKHEMLKFQIQIFKIKLNKMTKHHCKRNNYDVYDFDHVAKKASQSQILKKQTIENFNTLCI